MSSSYQLLPDELIFSIIVRLDLKDVLRFRYVSKSWYALINDRYFMEKHREHIENSFNLSLVIEVNYGLDGIVKVGLNNEEHVLADSAVHFDNRPVEFQIGYKPSVVGLCNGFLCLYDRVNWVAIWNPSARTLHKLPPMPIQSRGLDLKIYGFGHDRITDDYKVMGIVEIDCGNDFEPLCIEATVYSLKTKSWAKKSQRFADKGLLYFDSGTFASISNSLNWIMKRNQQPCFIGAFDLGVDNGYHEVQLPDEPMIYPRSLGVLRGSLCLFSTNYRYSNDLWVKKESWTRLITFADTSLNLMMKPLAYSRKGDKVLLQEYDSNLLQSKLLLYDLKSSKTVRVNTFPENLHIYVVGLYEEADHSSSILRPLPKQSESFNFLCNFFNKFVVLFYSML